jgi:hypothetical protein
MFDIINLYVFGFIILVSQAHILSPIDLLLRNRIAKLMFPQLKPLQNLAESC